MKGAHLNERSEDGFMIILDNSGWYKNTAKYLKEELNLIEIEDFGDQTVFNLLKKNNNQQLDLFKKSVQLLHKIQTI